MNFKQNVLRLLAKVPKGSVVSYGQIAAGAGSPRAARQVGMILRHLPADSGLPWWRVVNNEGVISIKGNFEATKQLQKELLGQDGVVVSDEYKIDMKKFRRTLK